MEIIAAVIGVLFMFVLIFFSLKSQKKMSKEERTKFKQEFVKPLN